MNLPSNKDIEEAYNYAVFLRGAGNLTPLDRMVCDLGIEVQRLRENLIPVRLRRRCCCYVGPPKWRNCDDFEPDECNTVFDTEEHNQREFDEMLSTATCPVCGAELAQKFASPHVCPHNPVSGEAGARP